MLLLAANQSAGSGSGWVMIVVYVALIIGFMYFMAIKPQKKQEKKQKEVMDNIAVGDSVLTTSGFYGMVIDVTEDTVIVEFGGNKNCRIPMKREAIASVEKPGQAMVVNEKPAKRGKAKAEEVKEEIEAPAEEAKDEAE